jgi:hypothetical protein
MATFVSMPVLFDGCGRRNAVARRSANSRNSNCNGARLSTRRRLRAQLGGGSNGKGAMTPREMEIAAKISKLRSMNMLRTQAEKDKSQAEDEEDAENGVSGEDKKRRRRASIPISFADLPDWKKEEVLQREMKAAESFLGTGKPVNAPQIPPASQHLSPAPAPSAESSSSIPSAPTPYNPKVSTWGVFPRPANISKEYGGGRPIPIGGRRLPENDETAAKKEADTQAKLAKYRKGQGINMELEREHEQEITDALAHADAAMLRSDAMSAVRALEAVLQFVSPKSQRGGDVCLALALGYEATGQREKARALYLKLKSSPFLIYARQARQLLAGFDAMEIFQVKDETAERGGLVTGNFELPDIALYTDKRYETAVYIPDSRKGEAPSSERENISDADGGGSKSGAGNAAVALVVLACLIGIPVAIVVLK